MLDKVNPVAFPVQALINTVRPMKENFVNGAPAQQLTSTQIFLANSVSLLIGVFCILLSWGCSADEPTPLRIFYAFFAFLFGPVYLIYYFFVRAGQCRK
jgi:hypothetical protein